MSIYQEEYLSVVKDEFLCLQICNGWHKIGFLIVNKYKIINWTKCMRTI